MIKLAKYIVANVLAYFLIVKIFVGFVRPVLIWLWPSGALLRDLIAFLIWGALVAVVLYRYVGPRLGR